MKKTLIYLMLLCLLNSLLFFGQSLGLNVILFTIPLLIFLYFYLKINKLINNKKGLLLFIPIIILSSTYLIYDNVFNTLNVFVIPILYLLMYIFTIKPTDNLIILFKNLCSLLLKPFNYISKFINSVKEQVSSIIKLSSENKKKIKSFIIIIPIVIIILMLLGSADMIFGNIFTKFFELFDNFSITNIINRIIIMFILFIYFGSTLLYLLKSYAGEKQEIKNISVDNYTIKLLLTILNVIYIIFDIIQIRSLMLHHVSLEINYAEYARSGFFQLMFISLINLVIILVSKHSKETKYNKSMSLLMLLLTLVIIISSFMRMYLYESTYGYTLLRLGVYIILSTETIMLIPTILYILNSKVKILKSYLIITITIYTFINLFSIENIITYNNIKRYYEKKDIDIYYLENYNYDNIPLLKEFYKKCDDDVLKEMLLIYFDNMESKYNINMDNILEYNISKSRAIKYLR